MVPIGGGKDSMVLIEALRPLRPRLLAVNPHPLVVELAAQAGLELLVVRRTISPRLWPSTPAGALNGHVPITAIVSLIAVAAGSVYGYDTVAMAIERSASEETVSVDGVPVNHQYSKSLEFELLFPSWSAGRSTPASPTARRCGRTPSWPSPRPLPASPATTPRSAAATPRSASRRRPVTAGVAPVPSAGSSPSCWPPT